MLDEPRGRSRRAVSRDAPPAAREEHSVSAATIEVALAPLPPLALLSAEWRALEERSDGTFFTSWSWIGAWLSTNTDADAALIRATSQGQLVGLAVVTTGAAPGVAGALGRRRLALHQRADERDAALFIEYNDILADRAYARATRTAVLQFLIGAPVFSQGDWSWGELRMPGLIEVAASAVNSCPVQIETHARECPWVDFAKAGQWASREDYLASLSRNTRAQVRRAIRLAEAEGVIAATPARGTEQRLQWLTELRALHEDTWQRLRNQPGAFAASAFVAFVDALVRQGGEGVEILRITAGPATIGLLLNFVFRGHVYAYQSGLAYRDDNKFKPGLICHAQAIVESARAGRAGYHFMAGESRYKSSLATATETLTWLTLRRRGAVTTIEQTLRWLKAKAIG